MKVLPSFSALASVAAASDGSGAAAFGGLLMLGMTLAAVLISVVWIIFPFIVDHHLRKLRGLQETTNYYLRRMTQEVVDANASAKAQPPATSPKLPPS